MELYNPKIKGIEEGEIEELALKLAEYMGLHDMQSPNYTNMECLKALDAYNPNNLWSVSWFKSNEDRIIRKAIKVQVESYTEADGIDLKLLLDVAQVNLRLRTTDEACYFVDLYLKALKED